MEPEGRPLPVSQLGGLFRDGQAPRALPYTPRDSERLATETAAFFAYCENPELATSARRWQAIREELQWDALPQQRQRERVAEWLADYAANTAPIADETKPAPAPKDAEHALLGLALGLFEPCPDGTLAEQEVHMVRAGMMLYRCGALNTYIDRLRSDVSALPDDETADTAAAAEHSPLDADPMAANARLRALLALVYLLVESGRVAASHPDLFAKQQDDAKALLRDIRHTKVEGKANLLVFMLNLLCQSLKHEALPKRKLSLLVNKLVLTTLGGLKEVEEAKNKARLAAELPLCEPQSADPRRRLRAKAYPDDLETFKRRTEDTFYGYRDPESGTFGPPPSTMDAIRVLSEHLYTPLACAQRQEEKRSIERAKTLPRGTKLHNRSGPVEDFYEATLPMTDKLVATLLWMILHCIPVGAEANEASKDGEQKDVLSNRARWLGELAWEPTEGDVAHVSLERTLEITLCALSNSILLLLKHLKVNSIFQFEHLALTVAGFRGVPLILKFFNRKMETFLTALNEIEGQHALAALWPLHQAVPLKDNVMLNSHHVPAKLPRGSTVALCSLDSEAVPDAAEETAGTASSAPGSPEPSDPQVLSEAEENDSELCRRNMSSAIALLRVLQKLIKDRPIRQMAAVVEGGSVILKRILRLENPWLNLYVLKVIKGMAIFCGRGWRKTNMRLLSRIDMAVRQRMLDAWFYENRSEASLDEQQQAMFQLAMELEGFNKRHYNEPFTETTVVEDLEEVTDMETLLKMDLRDADDPAAYYRLV